MEPDFLIDRLTQDISGKGHLDIKNIRERFLNALKDIERLEKMLEEKNTMLAVSAKEKDRLIHAVNKAFEDKKRLHDRLADFDVLRNMEIAELKQGIEKIAIEKDHLLKESETLLEDLFKRDKTIDELRAEIERKVIQLKDTQNDLLTAIEAMRKTESKYKEIEAKYRAIEQERDNLKERLDALMGIQKLEGLSFSERQVNKEDFKPEDKNIVEQQSIIERLSAEISELNIKLINSNKEAAELKQEKIEIEDINSDLEHRMNELKDIISGLKVTIETETNKNTSLKNEMTAVISLLDEKDKEKDNLNNKIIGLERDLQLKGEDISTLRTLYDADTKKFLSGIEKLTVEKAEISRDLEEIKEELESHKKSIGVSIAEKEAVETRLSEALGRIGSLEAKNAEYLRELSSKSEIFSELRQQIESDVLKYQADIEKLTAERDELNIKLTDVNKKAVSVTPFSDSQFLIDDTIPPSTTLNEPLTRRYPSMMIYREPSRFEWIKKIAGRLRF
jgi:chromosome segregation ATPase